MMLQQQQQQHQGLIGGSNNNNSADSAAAAAAQAQEYSGIGGELGGGAGSGGFSEEERGGGRIDDGERNSGGNRWPRQETLALLKIRSDMDTVFRDSSLKSPLWDEVSRKLAELGYHRSAKKCKEKFENVYKYHKRTKDGRTSKADGKTYRFFDQLEALQTTTAFAHHSPPPPASAKPSLQVALPPMPNINGGGGVNTTAPPPQPNAVSSSSAAAPAQVITTVPSVSTMSPMNVTVSHTNVPAAANHPPPPPQQAAQNHGFLFSNVNANVSLSNYSTSSSSSTDSEEPVEKRRKRKRKWKDLFGRLMKEVIDKQEELQTKFLDTLEKRERERIAREEAWRVQEMEKMNREHDMLVQERSIAAAKDAAVISFLQKITEQQKNMPAIPTIPQSQPQSQSAPVPAPAPALTPPTAAQIPFQLTIQHQPAPPPLQSQPQPSGIQQQRHQQPPPPVVPVPAPAGTPISLPPVIKNLELSGKTIVSAAADNGGGDLLSPSPSRWPKAEVQALINLRTTLDVKYQENGPKGPLWEEISSLMKKLGYNRNAKRCKEKWENINKYYKKVKESSKKRPEDSKTCPYFHQLDAIYREKASSGVGSVVPKPENQQAAPIMARPEQQWPPPIEQQRSESAENIDQNDDDEDDDDDDEDEAGEYEIVTNKTSTMATSIE